MILNKEDNTVVKGFAILLMVALHLFGFPSWIKEGNNYIQIIDKINIEYYFAKFGGICVAVYLFLSGYGMEKSSRNKEVSFKSCLFRILNLYKTYWIIFLIFTIIGYFKFDLNISRDEFILNFLGIKPSYNVFTWFIRLYVQLLLLFPIIKKILDLDYKKAIFISGGIYTATIFNLVFFYIFKELRFFRETFAYELLYSFGFWQFVFSMGYLFSKYNVFERWFLYLKRFLLDKKTIYLLGLVIVFTVRTLASKLVGKVILFDIFMLDFILSPLLIFFTTLYFKENIFRNLLFRLGQCSTGIWLIHSYFTLTYFQKISYFPKYSVLILIWVLFLTTVTSRLIFKIENILFKKESGVKKSLWN
ncbi:acyltransferase family protein [Cetobacterium sp.]|uniref:acyltransferase family protein n=1 Tax=Cetobacterium sp. TaxID=2071632 RepID=UPI003F3E7389